MSPIEQGITDAVHASWWNVDADAGVGGELGYTEDAVCRMPGLIMHGRDDIARGYARRQANGPRLSRHLVSNLVLELRAATEATAHYVVTLYAANGVAPLPFSDPSAICDVVDRFVAARGSWLISSREVTAVFVAAGNDSVLLGRGGSDA
ncbi:nuclear transport factor 2 family protein [Amycolatopsis sp. CA-128772]|uniref:nuclear transport factor 2 family protein n=1 Tax=Amycolatopsis sp. CA-128772 TaxID=2073159 RepID=UPI000CD162CD|nr:nuclear transport factor 2 family protein [Amycolatopsis sp. CA-128772]